VGVIMRIAGNNIAGYSGDGGPATSASLNNPQGLRVDALGNSYVVDFNNNHIRRSHRTESSLPSPALGPELPREMAVPPRARESGERRMSPLTPPEVSTSGTGERAGSARLRRMARSQPWVEMESGLFGRRGPALSVQMEFIKGVEVDQSGNVYVAEASNHVRRISPDGLIATVAGNGEGGTPSGDGGPAVSAALPSPNFLSVDPDGNLYVTSFGTVRKIDIEGIITRAAAAGPRLPQALAELLAWPLQAEICLLPK